MVSDLEKKLKKDLSSEEYLLNLYSGDFPIKHVYSAPIAPGNSRAGHYHVKKTERLCVIRGKICLRLQHVELKDHCGGIILEPSKKNTVDRIRIDPHVAHELENIGETMAELIILSDQKFDPENPDVCEFKFEW